VRTQEPSPRVLKADRSPVFLDGLHELVERQTEEHRDGVIAMLAAFDEELHSNIAQAVSALIESFRRGGKLLVAGNGGSAAEAQHLASELVGRFRLERRAVAALALHADTSSLTAIANDYSFNNVYARQIQALGSPGDVFVGISTSGQSHNVVRAAWAARNLGLTTIGYLGQQRGMLAEVVDIPLVIPSSDTSVIQEGHMLLTHLICGLVEELMFGRKARSSGKEPR